MELKYHCCEFAEDLQKFQNLRTHCRDRLKDLGVTINRTRSKSLQSLLVFSRSLNKKSSRRPSLQSSHTVFGKAIEDLKPACCIFTVEDSSREVIVKAPNFLVSILKFLRDHLETEGLFRKAGSTGQTRALRLDVHELETFFIDDFDDNTPHDVGNLLKQWLRELPEPLIPIMFHDTFLKCLKLPDNSRLEGILNVCLLLPPLHISTLSSLLRFLSEVVGKSPINKMGSRNTALVFTPCLFPINENITDIRKVSDTNTEKVEIVEMLINNSDMVGMISGETFEKLNKTVTSALRMTTDIALLNPKAARKLNRQTSKSLPDLTLEEIYGTNADWDDEDVEEVQDENVQFES